MRIKMLKNATTAFTGYDLGPTVLVDKSNSECEKIEFQVTDCVGYSISNMFFSIDSREYTIAPKTTNNPYKDLYNFLADTMLIIVEKLNNATAKQSSYLGNALIDINKALELKNNGEKCFIKDVYDIVTHLKSVSVYVAWNNKTKEGRDFYKILTSFGIRDVEDGKTYASNLFFILVRLFMFQNFKNINERYNYLFEQNGILNSCRKDDELAYSILSHRDSNDKIYAFGTERLEHNTPDSDNINKIFIHSNYGEANPDLYSGPTHLYNKHLNGDFPIYRETLFDCNCSTGKFKRDVVIENIVTDLKINIMVKISNCNKFLFLFSGVDPQSLRSDFYNLFCYNTIANMQEVADFIKTKKISNIYDYINNLNLADIIDLNSTDLEIYTQFATSKVRNISVNLENNGPRTKLTIIKKDLLIKTLYIFCLENGLDIEKVLEKSDIYLKDEYDIDKIKKLMTKKF